MKVNKKHCLCFYQKYMHNGLKQWQDRNNSLTEEECHRLLQSLKERHLNPIFKQLSGKNGASINFSQFVRGYSAIEQGFKSHSRGAKDVCAQVFYEFHPVGDLGIDRVEISMVFYVPLHHVPK